jgi:hypothetical protein
MRFGCDADGFAFYFEGVDPAGLDPPFFLNGPKEVFLKARFSIVTMEWSAKQR